MALTWVYIANLMGPPGDANAMNRFNGIDAAIAALDTKTANRDAVIEGTVRGSSGAIKALDPYLMRDAEDTVYAIPFSDRDGSAAGGVMKNGTFNFERPPSVMGQPGATFQPVQAPDYAYAFSDRNGYIAFGIRADGTVEFGKGGGSGGGGVTSLKAANDALGFTKTRTDRITTIGDSLTYGYFGGSPGPTADAWPSKLQLLLGGPVAVTNLAVSGYSVDEEAIRIGALPVPLTVTGGSIPASGAVNVTTGAVIGWVPAGTRSYLGSLAGIPGMLTRTSASDTALTFTRTTAGTATTVPAGTVFVSDYTGRDDEILFVLLGRNDVSNDIRGSDTSVTEHVIKGVKRIVDWQSRDIKKVVVLSVTNTQAEVRGTGRYQTVMDINAGFDSMYGPRYEDIRTRLVNDAIYALGITPTSADLTAMAADAIPASIMDDGTHWSKGAHTFIAGIAHKYLTDRDWTSS